MQVVNTRQPLPRDSGIQHCRHVLSAAQTKRRSDMRTEAVNGTIASPGRVLEMLSDRFGVFEAIAMASIKLARHVPEDELRWTCWWQKPSSSSVTISGKRRRRWRSGRAGKGSRRPKKPMGSGGPCGQIGVPDCVQAWGQGEVVRRLTE